MLKLGQLSTRTGIGASAMGGGDQQVSRFTINWRSSKQYVSALVPGEALKESCRSDASERFDPNERRRGAQNGVSDLCEKTLGPPVE